MPTEWVSVGLLLVNHSELTLKGLNIYPWLGFVCFVIFYKWLFIADVPWIHKELWAPSMLPVVLKKVNMYSCYRINQLTYLCLLADAARERQASLFCQWDLLYREKYASRQRELCSHMYLQLKWYQEGFFSKFLSILEAPRLWRHYTGQKSLRGRRKIRPFS